MTDKKENILLAALEMFAKEGYSNVSTNAIAKKAGVSEGLIFRHFTNKEGLLNAILKDGEDQANKHFANILLSTDPKEVLRKTMDLPLSISPQERDYWKLIYSLKWQQGSYDGSKMEPLRISLTHAFKKLGYKNPETEANALLVFFDGIAATILLQQDIDVRPMVELLKSKYDL